MQKYSPGVRFNHHMGTLETLSFVGEGVGAALYLAGVAVGQPMLKLLGMLLVIGAVAALLAHLGKPARAWRAVTRIATSGVSRGTAVISAFLGCGILALVAEATGFLVPLQPALTAGAVLFALPVMGYAGLLLRSMKAIRLWRGPLLPLSFAAHSVATGATVAAGLAAASAQGPLLHAVALGGLLLAGVLSAAHLLGAERSAGVRASLERLLAGDLKGRFLWGGGVTGLVVPLAALAAAAPAGAGLAVLLPGIAAVSRLYGDFAYRNCIVLAGAYEPIMPSFPQRALGAGLP